jgi:hypothetical protein
LSYPLRNHIDQQELILSERGLTVNDRKSNRLCMTLSVELLIDDKHNRQHKPVEYLMSTRFSKRILVRVYYFETWLRKTTPPHTWVEWLEAKVPEHHGDFQPYALGLNVGAILATSLK